MKGICIDADEGKYKKHCLKANNEYRINDGEKNSLGRKLCCNMVFPKTCPTGEIRKIIGSKSKCYCCKQCENGKINPGKCVDPETATSNSSGSSSNSGSSSGNVASGSGISSGIILVIIIIGILFGLPLLIDLLIIMPWNFLNLSYLPRWFYRNLMQIFYDPQYNETDFEYHVTKLIFWKYTLCRIISYFNQDIECSSSKWFDDDNKIPIDQQQS